MLFNYKVVTKEGIEKKGQIEAASSDIAVATLQRREYVVVSLVPDNKKDFSHQIFLSLIMYQ